MKEILIIAATAIVCLLASPAIAPQKWGDQLNGKYVNPIVPADFSDIDAIRVGDDYYAISSTMQFSPGMAVLHSIDLVNWTIIGHAINDLTQLSPDLNWDKMNRYGRGIWAGSIRYQAGEFWIYFATPDEGIFVTKAIHPAGPWSPPHALKRAPGWDDCSPLWDDDKRVYLVCTNFADNYKIHLFQLTSDGLNILPDTDRVIHQSSGSEANKLYKFGKTYYHLYSENHHAQGRVVMMERAASLNGPWEIKQLNEVDPAVDREPNQGGLIQILSGTWWFVTHQGTGGHWEGRTMSLLPVSWIKGWPVIGAPGKDGLGSMVWGGPKPINASVLSAPQTVFSFNDKSLAPQWEWNYQPRADKWSLSERPGFLRLHAFRPLAPGNLMKAGNSVSQRAMRTTSNQVTAKLDISAMADHQHAGLCHFAGAYSWLGVSSENGHRTLTLNENSETIDGPVIDAPVIWLRSTWNLEGVSRYSYSLNGTDFINFGNAWQLTWGHYRGDHVGVFTYNDQDESGFVDLESFTYTVAR